MRPREAEMARRKAKIRLRKRRKSHQSGKADPAGRAGLGRAPDGGSRRRTSSTPRRNRS